MAVLLMQRHSNASNSHFRPYRFILRPSDTAAENAFEIMVHQFSCSPRDYALNNIGIPENEINYLI